MSTVSSSPELRSQSNWIKRLLPYLIPAAGLAWVFYDLHPREVLRHVTILHWQWVPLALAATTLTYVCQGWRWSLLLRPVARVHPMRATQAIYAGLFTNEVLPFRLGDFARAYVVASWECLGITPVIPSMLVERLLDGVCLMVVFGLVVIAVPLPAVLGKAGDVLGVLVLLGTAAFLYVVFRRKDERREATISRRPNRLVRSASAFVQRLAGGLRAIGVSSRLYWAAGISLLMLATQITALWLLMLACGLQLPFWAATVVFIIVSVGTVLPNTPGNIGTYQLFTVLGLTILGADKTSAAGFSLVSFVAFTLPLVTIGAAAFSLSGLKLAAVRHQLRFAWAQIRG